MELLEYQFKPFKFTLKDKNQPPKDRPLPKVDHGIACNNDYLFSYACGHALNPIFLNSDENLRGVRFLFVNY